MEGQCQTSKKRVRKDFKLFKSHGSYCEKQAYEWCFEVMNECRSNFHFYFFYFQSSIVWF